MAKRILKGTLALAAGLVIGALVFDGRLPVQIINDAGAVVGRPLTPISVAGVARRTTRRTIRHTPYYVATLPAGCATVVVEGVTIQQCGSTYYQPYNNQYVVVEID
jgi:hypothetical protein